MQLDAISIRSRVLLLAAAMLAPVVGVLVYDQWARERQIESDSVADAGRIAQQIVDAQARLFEDAQLLLDLIAALPSVQRADAEGCHEALSQLLVRNPRYAGLGVFQPDGERICGSRVAGTHPNVANRSWFQSALKSGAFSIGEYQIGMLSGRPSIGLARPMIGPNGKVERVLYASLSLDWVNAHVVANALPADAAFLLLDRTGTILIANPGQLDWAGKSLANDPIFPAIRASSPDHSEELPGLDGRNRRFYFFRFKASDNSLVYAAVGIPLELTLRQAARRTSTDALILASAAIAILGFIYVFSERTLTQPLRRLAVFSRAVGEGEFGRRTGIAHQADEIGELARNLDLMSESLERYRAEEAARNRLTRETQEAGHIGSWQWVRDSPTLACTTALADIFRLDADASGIRLDALTGRLHPDDRPRLRHAMEAVSEAAPRGRIEFRLRLEDGETRHCVAAMWLADASHQTVIHGYVQDVTERKRAEEERERDARFLAAMLDNISDGILACNAAGELVVFNRALEEIYNEKLGDVLRSGWAGRFAVYKADGTTRLAKEELPLWRALQGERIVNEEIVIKTAQRTLAVLVNGQEIRDEAGARIGAVVTVRDVTALRKTELTLRRAQKLEAVGLLSGGIAHDFNNLLAIVIGNLDSLMLRVKDDKQRDLVAEALGGALRGAELVKQMLSFARRQQLDPAPVDVAALTGEAMPMWKRMLGDGIALKESFPEGLWHCVTDAGELETSLLNLLTNARDAMPKGGTVTVEAINEHLDEEQAAQGLDIVPGDYVKISVSDTGTGIPPELLSRVLEPFFTTRDPGQGSGLGLSMVYGFAKQSGGGLRIYSEQGHGTTVHLYLPRAAEVAPPAEAAAAEPAPAPARTAPSRTTTVLVVDDDDEVRQVAVGILADLGFDVVEAGDAEQAIAALRRNDGIGLVLSDVIMPGTRNGYELAELVLDDFPGVQVLLVTGFAESAARDRGGLDERVSLISKPYRRQELADRLHRILAQ